MVRKQSIANNRQNRDPWGNEDNQEDSSEKNDKRNQDQNQELPNLEDIFKKIGKKFFTFSRDKNKSTKSNNKKKYPVIKDRLISTIIAVTMIIWIMSGFYTIKEAERGVVIRFGKFSHLVKPGLNWKLSFIDEVTPVNVELVRELGTYGVMLTSDENVVRVEMNVQYRVTNPKNYLFNVTNGDDSLRQATDSALRGIIGRYTMDRILTEGRTVIRSDTQHELEETIRPYNMGITLLDVNFQAARPPDEVKAAFDDAIAARENEQQYIREAEAYANEVQPHANGKAQRILEDARAYCIQAILEAEGDIARFIKLLPEYRASPVVTRNRLYIETMEKVLSKTHKILISENKNNNNLIFLSLKEKEILKSDYVPSIQVNKIHRLFNPSFTSKNKLKINDSSSSNKSSILNQRLANAQRDHYQLQEGQ